MLAAIWLDRLPDVDEFQGSSGQAYQTGLVFLRETGLSVDDLVGAQTGSRVSGATFFRLTWARAGARRRSSKSS